MHTVMLGDTQMYIFHAERPYLERDERRQRQLHELRRRSKATKADQPATTRGFIPRLAGALGLL